MLQAIQSAFGIELSNELVASRLAQMNDSRGEPLDPDREARNLSALFAQSGQQGNLRTIRATSFEQLQALVNSGTPILVGFAPGPDNPRPHIAHLGREVDEGFESEQQFTSYTSLRDQLMEQGEIVLFIRA